MDSLIVETDFDDGTNDRNLSGDLGFADIIADSKAPELTIADAQAELARAARLALLGELAGSIIHEVNQPVTAIIASAEACLRWLMRDPAELGEARRSALRVIEEGRRASDVVNGLTSLACNGQLHFTEIQIHQAVEEVLILSKTELERTNIKLVTNFDMSMPNIEADRVQLQQVTINLVRNAIDAMAEIDGRARILTVSSKFADGHACVVIADTGIGIDPGLGDRLFDPLYTTKGAGLGLGLSICRKIICAHGGHLWAMANTGPGTTLTFTVPLRRSAYLPSSS
jgi:signal transduction histidine kinase